MANEVVLKDLSDSKEIFSPVQNNLIKVLEKTGMKRAGEIEYLGGTSYLYSLYRTDYQNIDAR